MTAQILMLSGYSQPSHHRKVELLANEPEFDIVQILQPDSGRQPGRYASANGLRTYEIKELPVHSLGRTGDPHRTIYWPPRFGLSTQRPTLIVCEHEQEGLMAAEIALQRDLFSRQTPLILYSWQNLRRRRSYFVEMVCAYTMRSAQHIVCASTEAVDVLRQQGFQGGVSVVPLFGVDTARFQPGSAEKIRSQWHATGLVIGYIGRFVPEKGLDTLLEAAASLDFSFSLIFVGAGNALGSMQEQAHQLGITSHCHFLPPVPNDQVADLMNAFDVLVLPSRSQVHWKEQFGRVLVEAMSCQIPVIGSRSGAIPEVIADAGLTFPEGDAQALAAALGTLAQNADLRRTLGQRGTRRVKENYSLEVVATKTSHVWRQVLNQLHPVAKKRVR